MRGTDLVRLGERSSGNWGISGTLDVVLEWRISQLKLNEIVGDGFRGFRFPASPQLFIGLHHDL